MPWKHMGGMGKQLHSFLTLALDGGEDQIWYRTESTLQKLKRSSHRHILQVLQFNNVDDCFTANQTCQNTTQSHPCSKNTPEIAHLWKENPYKTGNASQYVMWHYRLSSFQMSHPCPHINHRAHMCHRHNEYHLFSFPVRVNFFINHLIVTYGHVCRL
jgi:hypothetical protein